MRRITAAACASALIALMSPALVAPASAASGPDRGDHARTLHGQVVDLDVSAARIAQAPDPQAALRSAEQALAPKSERRASSQLRSGGEVTMKLLDLWAARRSLTGVDARSARQLLARPSTPGSRADSRLAARLGGAADTRPATTRKACSAHFCVHYRPSRSTPAYVRLVGRVMEHIHGVYQRSGYRMPAGDRRRGGNQKIDIYLLDLAKQGLYGYCQPEGYVDRRHGNAAFGFCALDNDYKASQYPKNTPKENLRVTAAHEFFHAVQFGYDVHEDRWLMEGMAAWVEDEVYPRINDNIQYLARSQLTKPWGALDNPNAGGQPMMSAYGSWIFFRWLSENRPTVKGDLPRIGLRIWRQLDSTRGSDHNLYSIRGVAAALEEERWSLGDAFSRFAAAALRPARSFDEGAAYVHALRADADRTSTDPYRRGAPVIDRYVVDGTGSLRLKDTRLPHLSSVTIRLNLHKGAGRRLTVNLRDVSRWGRVVVTAVHTNGRSTTRVFGPAKGRILTTVGANSRRIRTIDVTVVNISTRYRSCVARPEATAISCGGRAVHNRVAMSGRIRFFD